MFFSWWFESSLVSDFGNFITVGEITFETLVLIGPRFSHLCSWFSPAVLLNKPSILTIFIIFPSSFIISKFICYWHPTSILGSFHTFQIPFLLFFLLWKISKESFFKFSDLLKFPLDVVCCWPYCILILLIEVFKLWFLWYESLSNILFLSWISFKHWIVQLCSFAFYWIPWDNRTI